MKFFAALLVMLSFTSQANAVENCFRAPDATPGVFVISFKLKTPDEQMNQVIEELAEIGLSVIHKSEYGVMTVGRTALSILSRKEEKEIMTKLTQLKETTPVIRTMGCEYSYGLPETF